jgi:mannose-1-phosphate guanylyltransferase/mannose-6-phosphate isomerase
MTTTASDAAQRVIPVILSGGSGTRLWPLSRSLYPKQLLALAGRESMLVETARRVADKAQFAPPIIVCNDEHRFIVAEQMRQAGLPVDRIVLEPKGRNTAPAIAIASLLAVAADPEAVVMSLHSDHVITDVAAFRAAVRTALPAVAAGRLVTFGITPTRPETGYGYIKRGAALVGAAGCYEIERFVEKPDHATAERWLAEGGYAWNSGMFLFAAKLFLEELARLEPAMLEACRATVAAIKPDLDFARLPPEFAAVPAAAIDTAVMERTRRAAVVPAAMGWSDVGSWQALWEIGAKDASGNVFIGDVMATDVTNCYIRTDERRAVAALGVDDLVLVVTQDAVLVASRDQVQNVKEIVERLKADGRELAETHTLVYRPWGSYETLDFGGRFQVKRITVKPGQKLSSQMHHHRAEHWVVVEGTARVTRGDESMLLQENQSIYIPLGTVHRLENPGKVPLHLIEVQSGGYLGEDDIVRFSDDNGRR